ncbi:MAG: hypothetical protein K2V38_05275, partial [Gemmataceae bacterium]|nr:hypothetical protein [Gemmataceae bacterium]
AEFIRADIAMSLRDENDPARLRWELIEKPRCESEGWTTSVTQGGSFAREPLFRRGFPWCAALSPGQFLANADRILACAPVTGLAYRGADAGANKLFASSHFARITSLRVHSANLTERAVDALVTSPHTALEELDVRNHGFDQLASLALVRSPLFPRLTRLELGSGFPGGEAYVTAFAGVTNPTRLRDLTLTRVGLSSNDLPRLLTSRAVENLDRLRLTGNPLGLAAQEAVSRLPLDRLRKLDLSSTNPGPEGLRALSTSLTLSRLERLGYASNNISGQLLAELATCPEVSNLRVLDLSHNPLRDVGISALARSPHFAGLLVLNLSNCEVGDKGARALLESPLADTLVLLDLSGNRAIPVATQDALKAKMGDRVRL